MNGLWADGWFYISTAGLLVSGVLFFFLLGQYRAAADAADEQDELSEGVGQSNRQYTDVNCETNAHVA